MENKITNIKVVYDNKMKKFAKAYVTQNGKTRVLTEHTEINTILLQLKKQEQVSKLNELPRKTLETIQKYKVNKRNQLVPNPHLADWMAEQDHTYRIASGKLSKKNKYTGKRTKGLKVAIFAAAAIAIAGTIASIFPNKKSSAKEPESIVTNMENSSLIVDPALSKGKREDAPETWEEYMGAKYNSLAVQKTFSKWVMEKNIEPNIKTKKIGDKELTYGLTPEQAMAFSVYYNSNLYSNEKLLAILGDYSITGNSDSSKNIVNQVNDAVLTIELSWAIADNKEEMIIPVVEDKVVQDLIEKYADLVIEYKKASTIADKKAAKKKVEEALADDFIDGSNGVINLQDHPAAHIILNTVPGVFTLSNNALDQNLNKVLVGTEGIYDVATNGGTLNGKQVDRNAVTIPETHGLVDDPCAIYINRFDNFEEYRNNLLLDNKVVERANQTSNKTIETFEQAIKEIESSNISAADKKAQIKMYQKQLELTRASLMTSEYAEIVKDTYEYDSHDEHIGVIIPIMEEYVKVKGLTDVETLFETFKETIIKSIQDEKINNPGPFDPVNNPAGGKKGDTYETVQHVTGQEAVNIITPEQKQQAEQVENKRIGVVSQEEGQKEAENVQNIVNQLLLEKDAILNYYIENGPSAPIYKPEWANHKYEEVRNQYNMIRQVGIEAYNEIQRQKQNQDTITEDGVIDGSLTTDDSDVFDPNEYGEYQGSDQENTTNQNQGQGQDVNQSQNQDQNQSQNQDPTPNQNQNTNQNQGQDQNQDQNINQDQNQNAGTEFNPSDYGTFEGDHNNNPNQMGYSVSNGSASEYQIDNNVIEDTITTDDEGLWDPSQYGEYQSFDMSSIYESANISMDTGKVLSKRL